ncbi:hypothetical protein RB2501_11072 [Robiginitalea biformata HTCC2501]|uniref:DUF1579 domain-containing protein n=2 Tax=Flavobacteriaceae TaxID=49546 RepID=A4CMH1_ROBBH|nr:hypothetical protein RB2501_11072 [Robiginitalea biformata HTCC2501]
MALMPLVTARGQENPPDSSCNCCTEMHRAFDFWIGEWEVTGPDGSVLGTNRIERIQGGCVLQEHWETAGNGTTGTSLNYYNSGDEAWEQLWVDNSGYVLKLRGGPEDGAMVLASEPVRLSSGKDRVNRITWTPREDGTVRQHWQVLEGGEVVQTLFDGIYRRAE